jgi:catechol 2,3-dioxygenase-like lactoylglutathione lyase family enzyme
MEINGMAHVFLTVSDFAACRAFYGGLLPALGMKVVMDVDGWYYCVGGRTALGITRGEAKSGDRFVQSRVGLHHLCFRARERDDVDEVFELVKKLGANIVHPPQEDGFAPGYYSVLFEDPDGIRLEINHVPGRGLLQQPGSSGGA